MSIEPRIQNHESGTVTAGTVKTVAEGTMSAENVSFISVKPETGVQSPSRARIQNRESRTVAQEP